MFDAGGGAVRRGGVEEAGNEAVELTARIQS